MNEFSAPSIGPSSLPAPTLSGTEQPKAFTPPPASDSPLQPARLEALPALPEPASAWKSLLWDAIAWPTRGNGWLILLPGAVLGVAMIFGSVFGMHAFLFPLELGRDLQRIHWYSDLGWVALLGWPLAILMPGLAYFATYYTRVIRGTIEGEDRPPAWPSYFDLLQDVQTPLAVMATAGLSFLPVLGYYWSNSSTQELTPAALALDWLGAALFTVAMLGYITQDNLWREIPLGMIQVLSLPWLAWTVPASLLFSVRLLAYGLFPGSDGESLTELLLGCLLTACLIPVHGRLLGRVYLKYQQRLEG